MNRTIRNRNARSARRAEIDAQITEALAADSVDIELVRRLQAERNELKPKSNGRRSSKVYTEPRHPELLAIYGGKTVVPIVEEYAKEIRNDFGHGGVVAGITALLDAAEQDVQLQTGGAIRLSDVVRRAIVRRVKRKLDERIYGMGCLYVERANQILRMLYEANSLDDLKLPPRDKRQWIGRRELASLPDWDVDFERDWQNYLADEEAEEAEKAEADLQLAREYGVDASEVE